MELKALAARAEEIRQKYQVYNKAQGRKKWTAAEYAQGLVGDVGDLAKLILAKNNFREIEDAETKIQHQLADCLWSLFAIARELNIDLETSFLRTMDELQTRLSNS